MAGRYRTTCVLLTLVMFLGVFSSKGVHASSAAEVRILVNGKSLRLENDEPRPFIENGRVLVPMRSIVEALGATVSWDGATRTALASTGYHAVAVTIDQTNATRDGHPVVLDVAARIVGDRTFLPLRFTAESLGGSAVWDAGTRTAHITSEPEPSLYELDRTLRSMGFTDDRLSRLSREQKRTIVARTGGKGTLVGSSASSPDPDATMPTDVVKTGNEGDPDSETDVHLELITIRRENGDEGDYVAYWVGVFWHWDPVPIAYSRDKIALTWNGDFLAQQSSILNVYQVQVIPGTFEALRGMRPYWVVQSVEKEAFQQQFNGMAFNIDLIRDFGFWKTPVVGQSGLIAFDMTRPKSTESGRQPKEALIITKYYHRSWCLKVGTEGSISFNPAGASPQGKIDISLRECYSESPARGVNLRWYD